ncbi:MAG: hypothetical protein DME06_15895 [Candidatus Rokuibacteriota bacterium]|nr:MAG: hypothetical protein DME06_15895 [Candidatus Rokubacteria bacterium]
MSYASTSPASITSTSISRILIMARFSGRVTPPKVAMGAEVLFRPRSVRRARAEAIASGSGSSWSRMSRRSAGARWARRRSTRARRAARSSSGWITRSPIVPAASAVTPGAAGSSVRASSFRTTTGAWGAAVRSASRTRSRRSWGTARRTLSRPVRKARR